MKHHTRIYLNYFKYLTCDFIPCEICGKKSVDLHHVQQRGMGGDPQGKKDVIENIMALCRECHVKFGDKKQYAEFLKQKHKERMSKR